MTNTEILRIYNAWRQDKTNGRVPEDYGITPRMITEALDAVVMDAERYEFLCNPDGADEDLLAEAIDTINSWSTKDQIDKIVDMAKESHQ